MPFATPASGPTVLLVEDDFLVRIVAKELVEEAGFTVIEAVNADEAIPILESRDDIRVLITDINMPGSMDGAQLAAVARDRWPPIEIVLTSGKHRLQESDLPDRARFLPKPYESVKLTTLLMDLAFGGQNSHL